VIRFGQYQVDRTQGLMRGSKEVRITAKSLAVLCVLAERAGQVVSKEELFRAVWPDTVVSDSALTSCIREIRHALGDHSQQPQFIETLHRRGYRLLIPTTCAENAEPAIESRPGNGSVPVPMQKPLRIGRENVLREMTAASEKPSRGSDKVLFVTGEPGIGVGGDESSDASAASTHLPARAEERRSPGSTNDHLAFPSPDCSPWRSEFLWRDFWHTG
jgi:DNA-binding winged helix-turn-helix (wHTH) protein